MARRELGPAGLVATQAVVGHLSEDDRHLLVACSGGSDSLALAVATIAAGRRLDRTVGAVVVDHGLQPGSDAVAERTAGQLRDLGLPDVSVERVSVPTGRGPEAGARGARYGVLRRVAAEREATVLLGHTLDDQAETVLLGLVRGSGARSLAGMAVRTGILLRPFLGLPRDLLRTVCTEIGLEPWNDPHNTDAAYTRPRVRHRVLPVLEAELGPGIASALARTARLLRDDADLLDSLAAQAVADRDDGALDCVAAEALPPALRSRVVRRWLRAAGSPELGLDHVAAVDRLLTHWHGQRWIGVPGLRVRRIGDLLVAEAL